MLLKVLGLQGLVIFSTHSGPFFLVAFLFLELTTTEEAIQSPPQVKNISYICLIMAVDLRFPSGVKHFLPHLWRAVRGSWA